MKMFRTILPIPSSEIRISYQTPVCLMGSCFTEHIGGKLRIAKLPILQNPFGILYNPFAIARSIDRIISHTPYRHQDLVQQGDRWVSFDHHGHFAKVEPEETLATINESLSKAHSFLKEAKIIFISLGTANVYRRLSTGDVVANCHKFPASDFDYYLAEKEDIVLVLAQAIKKLQSFNPAIKVIFTVSPVRHLKDGFVENKLSKATLLLAIKDLRENNKSIDYFPSYEILLDDLRDYRFYASDMIHPSREAVDYIFEKFMAAYFDEETKAVRKEVIKILNATQHQPFNPSGKEYQDFVATQLTKLARFVELHPNINFDQEIVELKNKSQA